MRLLNRYLKTLERFSRREASLACRIISLTCGAVFFGLVLPSFFFYIGSQVDRLAGLHFPRYLELVVAIAALPAGLFWLVWATVTQWRIGRGTPALNAPTRSLIVAGPYRYCRNPIELGAVIYYLGTGTVFGSLLTGMVSMALGLLIGSVYHKFIEERELALRFGSDYERYRENTPFLIPRLRRP